VKELLTFHPQLSILFLMQPSLFESVQWTVSTLTKYIRNLVETDISLQDVWVEGEISNLSRPASGHMYFTLKDAGASLKSVMWKAGAARLKLSLQDGMAVAVHGKIGVYEVGGQYQLYVDQIQPVGEGALFQEFLQLKALLESEGLFDISRKRTIPELPKRIGIVSSPSGAAIKDMLNTLRRRLPLVEVVFAPSPVQGEDAPPKLVDAITSLNNLEPRPDVILLARGGGSIEDLWAFNDVRVVRAMASSRVPIICGVGHETDFTLADFAADLRAPTPTAAAELATSITVDELVENLRILNQKLSGLFNSYIGERHNVIASLRDGLRFFSPHRRIQSDRQHLDDLARRVIAGGAHIRALEVSRLEGLGRRLEALNPIQILARGYAVVTRLEDGLIVHKVGQAHDDIRIRVSDGEFDAKVVKHI
jgi:exodeoxyribonuclease VII large subunit